MMYFPPQSPFSNISGVTPLYYFLIQYHWQQESGNCDQTLCLKSLGLPTHRSAVSSLCGFAGMQARPLETSAFASADGVSLQRQPSVSPSGHTGAAPTIVTKPENQRRGNSQRRSRETG